MSAPVAVDFGTGVSNTWSNIANAIPKFLLAVVIFVIAYLVAKALAKIVNTVLERVGFDQAVERGGIRAALAKSKYDASDIVAKLVYYAILLIGLSMAFGVFGPNPISDYLRSIIAYLPKVFVAIVILVIAAAIAKAVKDLVANMLSGVSYGGAVATVVSAIILVIGVFAALDQLEIAQRIVGTTYTALLVTLAGIAIVGIGGGLVRPMQQRWEGWLSTMSQEGARAKEQMRSEPAATEPYPLGVDEPTASYPVSAGGSVSSGQGDRGTYGDPAQRP